MATITHLRDAFAPPQSHGSALRQSGAPHGDTVSILPYLLAHAVRKLPECSGEAGRAITQEDVDEILRDVCGA